jgi:hypothetical protein
VVPPDRLARVQHIKMVEPVLIVSQSHEDHSLNLERFKPPPAKGMQDSPGILHLARGIEVGEHTGGKYTPLRRVQMDGRLFPRAEPGASASRSTSTPPGPASPGPPASRGSW